MTERWACVFEGRAGGRARAVFGTSEQARQFAERHARTMLPPDVALMWEAADASTAVLTTQLGTYMVAPIGTASAPAAAPASRPPSPADRTPAATN